MADQGLRPISLAAQIEMERHGLSFVAGSDTIQLTGTARAALTTSELVRSPAKVRLRSEGAPFLSSVSFGLCQASQMELPPFEAWRPGLAESARRDDAVVAVLHRRGAMRFTNRDGSVELPSSTLLIHRFFPETTFESDEPTDRIALRIPTQIMPSQVRQVILPYILLDPDAPGLPTIYARVVAAAMRERNRLRPADRSRLQRTLVNLIADLIAQHSDDAVRNQTLSLANLRARAIAYIEENLHSIGEVAEVAAAMHCSPRQLYNAFAERRCTPARFIWHRRLECARAEIASRPDKTLAEIAYRCGFQSYAHFSRTYKKVFGVAPVETPRDA